MTLIRDLIKAKEILVKSQLKGLKVMEKIINKGGDNVLDVWKLQVGHL